MTQPAPSRLTFWALVIALVTVIARATILESVREPFGPQSILSSRGGGAGVGLILDLVCCLPALLILAGRALGKIERRPMSWACLFGGILAAWAAASTLWSDDKFAAIVSSAHLAAAMALLWAAAQVVTTWGRLRLVAAICFGLLLVNLIHAILWRYSDMPNTLAWYQKHKTEILAQLNWKPGDFSTRQLETKLQNSELLGFTSSANSFAATLVLLMGVSAGLAIQRLAAGENETAAAIAAAFLPTLWILYLTQCKAAFITTLIVAIILLAIWRFPRAFSSARRAYATGVRLILAGMVAVVGYGIWFGGLPTASLNFRWRYWIAARQLHHDHPLLGVGWSNFGLHYLHYRLLQASEEIQDPHNFLLRFLTELGIIGLALGIAWIARLWWELARPAQPPPLSDAPDLAAAAPDGIRWLAIISALGIGLGLLSAADFTQGWMSLLNDLLNRTLFAFVLVFGGILGAVRSLRHSDLDERPAPWVLYAILASLGAFLIHNLIEFSLFETGPMMLFALLAGSALGVRRQATIAPARLLSIVQFAGGGALWVAAAIFLTAPVVVAEGIAHDGDDQLHLDPPQYDHAEQDYQSSSTWVPYNADYLYRAAMAESGKSLPDYSAMKRLLDQAIAINPSMVSYYSTRARTNQFLNDAAGMQADYEKALDLDPNEASLRLDYANALLQMRMPEGAARQYELALQYNDALPPEEPKRINDAQIRRLYAGALILIHKPVEAIAQARQALRDNDAFADDDPRRLSPDEVTAIQNLLAAAPR
ncbi:MAG: O-antigen ligase family protein [Tepidisphaeraceae bacterium]